jgi:CheY-like chemotaxis protein
MAHVLVVDDDPTVSDVVRRYLQQDGCRVRLAPDGLAALAAVAAKCPDLVVLDLMMPGLDGLEVCRRLRFQLPGLPVRTG